MTRICDVTGKVPLVGHRVSHARNRTTHRFLPNLHEKEFFNDVTGTYHKLRVSAKGMRIIDKHGLHAVLEQIKARDKKTEDKD